MSESLARVGPEIPNPISGHRHQRVVLIGFMGAGKTTVGRLLGSLLGWSFLDADAMLCQRAGTTVAALFAEHGEAHFRVLEAEIVAELANTNNAVIALGGGAVEHAGTRHLLTSDTGTLLVYLEVPLAAALIRCANESAPVVRPVLANVDVLEQRFVLRTPLYRMAHLIVPTEGSAPEALAQQIAARVRL